MGEVHVASECTKAKNEGKAEGKAEGVAEAMARMSALAEAMQKAGRADEFIRACGDTDKVEHLSKELGL